MQDVNEAFCTLVGRPRTHLIGTSVLRLTHEEDLERKDLRPKHHGAPSRSQWVGPPSS